MPAPVAPASVKVKGVLVGRTAGSWLGVGKKMSVGVDDENGAGLSGVVVPSSRFCGPVLCVGNGFSVRSTEGNGVTCVEVSRVTCSITSTFCGADVGDPESVEDGKGVMLAARVLVGVAVCVSVAVGESVGLGVGDGDGVRVLTRVGGGPCVGKSVEVGSGVSVIVAVKVAVAVGGIVLVAVGVLEGVDV